MNLRRGREIRDNAQLKESFFRLGHATFGLDYADWNRFGYWDNTYEPYGIEVDGELVANISISKSTLVVDGVTYKAAQIGGVMTAPNYRGQGLSRRLMEEVLRDTENVDLVYLFANSTVLEYYPKFGFEKRMQSTFTLNTSELQFVPQEVKKLNLQDAASRKLLFDFAMHRVPVSTKLSMLQHESIVMFHALNVYDHCTYVIPSLNVIIMAEQKDDTLHVYDVISKHYVKLEKVLAALPVSAPKIELYFTPNDSELSYEKKALVEDGAMFVKEQHNFRYPENKRFPITSYA